MNTYSIVVREAGEWGEFLVSEREPEIRISGGKEYTQYTATWCCYSSFGVFGHHWYSLVEPFGVFIQDVDDYYLLGKIAAKVTDHRKAAKAVKEAILQSRRDKRCSKEEAGEAMADVQRIMDEACDEHAWPHLFYESTEISRARIEWCDLETQEYPQQAKMFVKKIWPKFVEAMKERINSSVVA